MKRLAVEVFHVLLSFVVSIQSISELQEELQGQVEVEVEQDLRAKKNKIISLFSFELFQKRK